jgi:hypothetical protein
MSRLQCYQRGEPLLLIRGVAGRRSWRLESRFPVRHEGWRDGSLQRRQSPPRRVRTPGRTARIVAVCILVLVATYGVAMILSGGGVGRPILWEVPRGFRGWASFRHGASSCPPLQTRGLYIVASALLVGEGCTSSPPWPTRWRYYRLEFVGSDGARSAGTLSKGRFFDKDLNRHFLFVGTDEELQREGGPRR